MIIEWYTIVFQVVNFIILVFLLRRYLYGPVVKSMAERESTILQRETDAEAIRQAGETAVQRAEAKEAELEAKAKQVLAAAQSEAKQQKREWLVEARESVEDSRKRWQEGFQRERETFLTELRRHLGREACRIAERCLSDLADARLEDWVWDQFLSRLADLPAEELQQIEELATSEGYWVLRSAFDADASVAEERRGQLEQTLRDRLPQVPEVKVKVDADLICGFELEAEGHRVAWSVQSYLEDVEARILDELQQAPNALRSEEESS